MKTDTPKTGGKHLFCQFFISLINDIIFLIIAYEQKYRPVFVRYAVFISRL